MTTPCSPKVQQIVALRIEAAVLRAAYEEALSEVTPLRHRSADFVLQARALTARLGAAERSELRRVWGGA
jgi:hypothetical protein